MRKSDEILHLEEIPDCLSALIRSRDEKDLMFLARALGIVVKVVYHDAVPVWWEGDVEFEE